MNGEAVLIQTLRVKIKELNEKNKDIVEESKYLYDDVDKWITEFVKTRLNKQDATKLMCQAESLLVTIQQFLSYIIEQNET